MVMAEDEGTDPVRPAEALLGVELNDGWVVVSAMAMADDATGSTFSVPYIVERCVGGQTERAFLRAGPRRELGMAGRPAIRSRCCDSHLLCRGNRP